MFNTLKYAKQLIEAGFSREQAETQMQIMSDLLESKLAKKEDLENLGTSLRSEMKQMEASLRSDMNQIGNSLRADMNLGFKNVEALLAKSESRIQRNLTVIFGALASAIIAISKIF